MQDLDSFLTGFSAGLRAMRQRIMPTLGDLIQEVSELPPSSILVLADGRYLTSELGSYRGYYEDLAIAPTLEKKRATTAKGLLKELKGIVGSTLSGYKGGEFRMCEDTPVWVSCYGDASQEYITSFRPNEDGTITVTLAEAE